MADPTASPATSSLYSSDLDTQSTGSFFRDTSTTLGTLMGVTIQAYVREQEQRRENPMAAAVETGRRPEKRRAAARWRRRWWMLCRDEAQSRRASLGEYLAVERRFGDGAAVELEEALFGQLARQGRALFADGRVLPPEGETSTSPGPGAGICSLAVVERCCSLVL